MKTKNLFVFILFYGLCFSSLHSQATEPPVKIVVTPDRDNWVYKPGETATFKIEVFKDNALLKNAAINYELGPEYFPTEKKDNVVLEEGTMILKSSMNVPGFLRCKVVSHIDGKRYESAATAGYNPEDIAATTTEPHDFDNFWTKALEDARKVPLDSRMKLIPEKSTPTRNVYEISFQNEAPGSRMYGILSVPVKPGKYPAVLEVPGAGIRPYGGTNRGDDVITLQMGIHGIPVTLEKEVYDNLNMAALKGYPHFNKNDRDKYYYKRVYTGCVRAIDFIYSLTEFDGNTIGVTGGSQGGALSIVTAALDNRIKFLAAYYPALCDLTGYLDKRAGGWPHNFRDAGPKPGELETVRYYDVVSFARRLTVPGWYSWGYNDNVCPPTSMYGAYNAITAPKELGLYLPTGHHTVPEQTATGNQWISDRIGELKK